MSSGLSLGLYSILSFLYLMLNFGHSFSSMLSLLYLMAVSFLRPFAVLCNTFECNLTYLPGQKINGEIEVGMCFPTIAKNMSLLQVENDVLFMCERCSCLYHYPSCVRVYAECL